MTDKHCVKPSDSVAFRDSREITMFTLESIEQRYMVYYNALIKPSGSPRATIVRYNVFQPK